MANHTGMRQGTEYRSERTVGIMYVHYSRTSILASSILASSIIA